MSADLKKIQDLLTDTVQRSNQRQAVFVNLEVAADNFTPLEKL